MKMHVNEVVHHDECESSKDDVSPIVHFTEGVLIFQSTNK